MFQREGRFQIMKMVNLVLVLSNNRNTLLMYLSKPPSHLLLSHICTQRWSGLRTTKIKGTLQRWTKVTSQVSPWSYQGALQVHSISLLSSAVVISPGLVFYLSLSRFFISSNIIIVRKRQIKKRKNDRKIETRNIYIYIGIGYL